MACPPRFGSNARRTASGHQACCCGGRRTIARRWSRRMERKAPLDDQSMINLSGSDCAPAFLSRMAGAAAIVQGLSSAALYTVATNRVTPLPGDTYLKIGQSAPAFRQVAHGSFILCCLNICAKLLA